jgi:hypothetical protein
MSDQFGGSGQGGPSNFPNSLEQHLAALQQQNQHLLQQQAGMKNQMQNLQIGQQPWTQQGHMTGHYGYGAPGPVWQPAPYYPPVPPPMGSRYGYAMPPQQNWMSPAPGYQGPQNQNRGQNRRNNQQQPRNSGEKVCGNCELLGHESKDCVKVDSNGYVNACPAHNTRRHNLWTCNTKHSEKKLKYWLWISRDGLPQLAWGEDMTRSQDLLNTNPPCRPWTKEYAIKKLRENPEYWKTWPYKSGTGQKFIQHDPAWNFPASIPNQRDTRLDLIGHNQPAQGSQIRRRSASPTRDETRSSARDRSPTRKVDEMKDAEYDSDGESNETSVYYNAEAPEEYYAPSALGMEDDVAMAMLQRDGHVDPVEYKARKIVYDTVTEDFMPLCDYEALLNKRLGEEIAKEIEDMRT